MSKILSLDQASRVTGWAVFEGDQLLDSGTFTVVDNDIGLRLVKIRNFIISMITDYNIEEVVLEDIQLQGNVMNNVQTFKTLAEVFGVIYETVLEQQLPCSAVLASVWKSGLQIKGKDRAAQKRNAQEYVINTYSKKVSQDESDAICIGAYYIQNKEKSFDWSD